MKPAYLKDTEDCRQISEMLNRVGDKWSMLIISYLGDGTHRFSDLRRRVGSISQKMLTTTLRNLERDGFVRRTVYPTVPPKVEYELTDLGRELQKPVAALADWTREHMSCIADARKRYDEEHGVELAHRTAAE